MFIHLTVALTAVGIVVRHGGARCLIPFIWLVVDACTIHTFLGVLHQTPTHHGLSALPANH